MQRLRFHGITDYPHDTEIRTGILIANLGTPDAPTAKAVWRYLAEFLSDSRVVEMPRWIWKLILYGFILPVRSSRVAKAYQSVWLDEGSPLLAISQKQASALQIALSERLSQSVEVGLAMRYGNPSVSSVLHELASKGVRRLLVFPLYPQYSATTTASLFDAVFDTLKGWRWLPELRLIQHYHDNPVYIAALKQSIEVYWQLHGQPDRLLMSFHGIPERYLRMGDPYYCECQKTGRLLAESLGLNETQWALTFQSRFGREPWLQPYTDHTLKDWAKSGVEHVQVVCPGFSADCLETLEEIDDQNRKLFLASGGKKFEYIPALNDQPGHIQALADIVLQHIQGWPESGEPKDADQGATERAACLDRARVKGA